MELIEGKIINRLRVFTSTETLEVLDLEAERLRQWIKLKFVEPTINATGSGTKNYFSKIDIYKVAVFKKLVDIGLNRWMAKQITKEFSDEEWYQIQSGSYAKYLFVAVQTEDRKRWKDSMELYLSKSLPEELDWEIAIVLNFDLIAGKIKNRIW